MDSCKKIYLCNATLDKICVLNGVQTSSVSYNKRIKDYSSLSFTVDRYIMIDGQLTQSNGYELLDTDMYLYLEDIGYFRTQYPTMENDGQKEFKTVNSSSIEKEFRDKDWINFKCNTGDKDSLEQLAENNLNDLGFAKEFIVFYNPKKPQLSLLHIIMKKMNGWNIDDGDIDPKLWGVKLSISETQSVDLYDLLTSVIAPKANCLFIFDILNRKLKAIHKDSLNDKKYDTNIFIGYRNLAKTINVTVDEDSIYTAFNCSGNDDLTINDWNYNSPTIFNFDYFLSEKRVSKTFIEKVKKWETWRNDNRQHFADLSKQRADKNEKAYELQYKVPNDALNWKQWDKMEEKMLKENQKYYQTLLISLQVSVDDNPQYTQDESGNKVYIPWKKTDGSIDHERYLNKLHELENGYGGYYTYIEINKYILPNIQIAIDNLGIETNKKKDYVTDFETDWNLYGIEELKSKKKDYENRLEALKKYEKPWSELSSEEKVNYPGGEPEYNKLGHTEFVTIKGYIGSESASNTLLFQLKQLNLELEKLNSALETIDSERNTMISQAQINHSSYGMSSNDLIVFYRLQKYTDYQNSNIISTSIDTTVSIIDREKELFDDSTDKLIEVSQPQFTFHTQIDNLLRLKEFALWADDLELLNFIRLGIRDDYSVKLRIIGITWNPCEITSDLDIEFSNMITSANGRNDLTNLLSSENNRGSKNSYSFGTGNSKSEQEYLTNLLQLMINNNLFHQAVGDIAGNTNGIIDNIEVGNIVAEYLKVTKIDVNKITGDEADFNKIFANYIDAEFITTELIKANEGIFKNLNADTGFIKHLKSEIINADSIVTELIKADEAIFKNLTADTGFIKHLQSEIIDTSVINTDIANIKQLLAGVAGIGDLQSIHLTAKNVVIDEAVIKNLIASKITVADLLTQKATAQMITLISSDGKPSIAFQNSTQQFYDNKGNVRVQIGQDGNGNFNFVVRGEDGTTALFDSHGIKKDGIPDNTIVNNMIENQAISKDKLSFPIIEPNEQGGLDITQIYDGSGNKWGVEYYNFKETINGQLSDLEQEVDNIQVGGRNLLRNSTFDEGLKYWTSRSEYATVVPEGRNGENCLKQVGKLRTDSTITHNTVLTVKVGESYTLSGWAKGANIVKGTTNYFVSIYASFYGADDEWKAQEAILSGDMPLTDDWEQKVLTFQIPNIDGITSMRISILARDFTGTIWWDDIQLETGNKATDWSPAPEDTEEQFNTITSTLSGVQSTVNKVEKSILEKVWQDDITTKINNYDGTVTESIRNRVTESEKNLNGIKTTVKDMETTVSKKADGSTVETLNTKLAKVEQDANGFKTTVQDYFSTTDKTLNGIQSWKTEVNQKISKDGILSTVGDYYATQDDLNNLNIGGSNLVNRTDVQALNNTSLKVNGYTFNISGQVTSSNFDGVFIPDTIFQKDEFYVFSYKFTVKSGSVTKIGGHQAAFKIVKAVVDGIEYKTEYDAGYPLDNKKTEHTVAVYLKYHGVGSDQKLYIQPNRQGGSIGTWNIVLTELQIEKGNTKTAWSPSYQDMMNDIQTGSRNFLRNGNFAETTTSPGNTNKHHNLYPLGWGGYNGGIDNPTTSWHAHIDNTTFGFNVVEFNESDGNRNWKGLAASPDFIFIEKVDQEYRLSVDVYATGPGTKLTGGFYYCKKGESTQNFHSGQFEIRPKETNKWVRMSVAVPLKDDIDLNSKKTNLYIYGYGFDSNSILYIKDAALTTGNKTADWTPAPEETNMQIAKVETIANQTKDKFTWLVKSGTSSTNFELTDRAATLVANYINLKGLVTFAGLNSDTQGKISSAKSTADAVTSIVNNNKANWDKGYNWTNTNGGNMSKMLDMVKTWTDGALTTTTTINGGFIRTNTINASHLTLGDFTNLVDVNESLPQSAVPDNTHPFGSHAKPICKNGYWYKESAASEYLALSSYKPNSFADGDELYYEFTAHSELAGNYFIALWFYNGASKEFQTMKRGNIESVTTSDKTFSGIIKLEDAKKYDFFAIGIGDNNNTHAQIYAKNISVRKKTNASLIVDGSIVGKHIAANTIDASKIQIGNLNNICVVNPDTYNPYGLAVIESHGQKYFRLGANTDSSTPRYISLPLRRNISSNTYYPVGDCWKFRAYGYQTVAGVAYTFCIRVLYTDGSNTNLGTCRLDPPAYNPGYFEGICQITTKPIAGKPISHFEIFIETGHKKSHYLYLRDITIYSMTNATLLEDGSVTTDKLTTSNIVGTNGWINLRSGTFNYGNGKFVWNGSTLTVNGSGSFSGTITSSAGTIGGWSINGSSIYHGSSDYNASTGMYFGTSGLRLGSAFKVNSNGYATINGGTFTGTINAETGKISGWRLLSSRLVSLDVDVQNETDFKNKGTKAVYLAKYNYNGQGSVSAIGVQTRTSTSNQWVNRIDIRYDGSMIFKNQNDVIVTKFDNGNWSDIGTISCNDIIVKQNSQSYKLSHRMLVCDDTTNVLGVGMTTSGDRFIPMKDKKADYAHGKIAIGSNQNRFSEIWSVKALNTTSDRNLKTNISSFDERYENFFMDLNTCTFMYKNFTYDDTHDRLHWGIDAQQAEQALIKNNITLGEAGFLCIDNLEYPNAAGQMKEYSVRYSELIGLNIHMTQKSYMRIKELEKRNQELENRIALLEERLK